MTKTVLKVKGMHLAKLRKSFEVFWKPLGFQRPRRLSLPSATGKLPFSRPLSFAQCMPLANFYICSTRNSHPLL